VKRRLKKFVDWVTMGDEVSPKEQIFNFKKTNGYAKLYELWDTEVEFKDYLDELEVTFPVEESNFENWLNKLSDDNAKKIATYLFD